jgi:ABC-type Zn uptake system ZnuABC Zn-binding protein ZnuA
VRKTFLVLSLLLALSACGRTTDDSRENSGSLIVTTSSIVEDIVKNVAGDGVSVVSLIPNGFDSHTYEPKPSEIELLIEADLIIMADRNLNQKITQLAELSGDKNRILDLNAESLENDDYITKETSSRPNPHTWTDPNLVKKWVDTIFEHLTDYDLVDKTEAQSRKDSYLKELSDLDEDIAKRFGSVNADQRRLVVYHDAWEYFAKRYGLELVGTLQAVNFAEPSVEDIERLSAEIKRLQVQAFFGSEVFPSDVLETLERESGAMYVSDLADDKLLGEPGEVEYGYVPLMRHNLELLAEGLLR